MDQSSSDPDPVTEQCLKLKRQLDDLVNMTEGLEQRLADAGMDAEERANLEGLRKRYAREAVELMMRIDLLEDPDEFEED